MESYEIISGPMLKERKEYGLPSTFNPRRDQNIPPTEKVESWMDNVPWVKLEDNIWCLECYSGTVSVTSLSCDFNSGPEHLDLVELQARQITRIVMQNYLYDNEVARPPLSEEGSVEQYHPSGVSLASYYSDENA